MRIVVDVKKDANAKIILNKLFKMTALQSSFSVNCIALVPNKHDHSQAPPETVVAQGVHLLFY